MTYFNRNKNMLTSLQLQQMGLIGKDDRIKLKPILSSVNPENLSTLRKAYCYGLGMMLDYNSILLNNRNLGVNPEYLHLVIASEIEPDGHS